MNGRELYRQRLYSTKKEKNLLAPTLQEKNYSRPCKHLILNSNTNNTVMRKLFLLSGILLGLSIAVSAQLEPGDQAVPFTLKNVDGKMVSLSDYEDEKGVILVFTCNPCPFAKAYEQRIVQLHEDYAAAGYPVVAVNPNDDMVSPDDTFE